MSPEPTVHSPSAVAKAMADEQSQPENLRVKELAESLGVSKRFVYQMRACGFPMRGHDRHSQTATVQDARDWIKANNFRLVKGVGMIGNLPLATDRLAPGPPHR